MGRGGLTLSELLMEKSVQEELKLTEDQIKSVRDVDGKRHELWQGLEKLPQEERWAKIQERIKENEAGLAGVIGSEQMARLKQISLQVRGMRAFSDPTVVKDLSLTDEQNEKLRTIRKEAWQSLGPIDWSKREENREKFEAAGKAAYEKSLEALTTEQAAKWKEMIGAPFTGKVEIRRPEFGGRRRGGGDRIPGTPPPDQA
jgi:hypothetical protein